MRSITALAMVLALGCEGPRGPAGMDGDTGPRGGEGADGKTGARGAPGTDGKPGQDGADGARGLTGARGPAGAVGPQGPSGGETDGGAGRGYEPGLWLSCVGLLDLIGSDGNLGTDGVGETLLEYRVTAYVGQDVDVSCSVALGAAETATGGGYLPAVTVGAQTAACSATRDYPPAGPQAGRWDFALTSSGPRATYVDSDSGHPLNGHFYDFVEADCNVERNAGTGWTHETLADTFGP